MKVSKCCQAKMISHNITRIKICSKCGYASTIINIEKGVKKRKQKPLSLIK